jgi:hypothetical protein
MLTIGRRSDISPRIAEDRSQVLIIGQILNDLQSPLIEDSAPQLRDQVKQTETNNEKRKLQRQQLQNSGHQIESGSLSQ